MEKELRWWGLSAVIVIGGYIAYRVFLNGRSRNSNFVALPLPNTVSLDTRLIEALIWGALYVLGSSALWSMLSGQRGWFQSLYIGVVVGVTAYGFKVLDEQTEQTRWIAAGGASLTGVLLVSAYVWMNPQIELSFWGKLVCLSLFVIVGGYSIAELLHWAQWVDTLELVGVGWILVAFFALVWGGLALFEKTASEAVQRNTSSWSPSMPTLPSLPWPVIIVGFFLIVVWTTVFRKHQRLDNMPSSNNSKVAFNVVGEVVMAVMACGNVVYQTTKHPTLLGFLLAAVLILGILYMLRHAWGAISISRSARTPAPYQTGDSNTAAAICQLSMLITALLGAIAFVIPHLG